MTTEERARFEVLLEEIKSGVAVIAEGHGALDAKVTAMATKLDANHAEVSTRLGVVEMELRRVKDRLGPNGNTPETRGARAKRPRRK